MGRRGRSGSALGAGVDEQLTKGPALSARQKALVRLGPGSRAPSALSGQPGRAFPDRLFFGSSLAGLGIWLAGS